MSDALKILAESQLNLVRKEAIECTKCKLHDCRTQVVFGTGKKYKPDIMFIGEGPGRDEDFKGEPFVGQAGKLLDRLLVKLNVKREDVYIDNIVKCRPPDNRVPEADEGAACTKYLFEQINIIQPKIIVCLGATAAKYITGKTTPMKNTRVGWHLYKGIPVKATYHPAWLLRMNEGSEEWITAATMILEDMQQVMSKIDESKKAKTNG